MGRKFGGGGIDCEEDGVCRWWGNCENLEVDK